MAEDRSILIITPCRNEVSFVGETIRSVAEQTLQPTCWIIVDDGSTDASREQIQKVGGHLDYLELLQRERAGGRVLGSAVIDTFYFGLDQVDLSQFSYICKLDADISLPPAYFQTLVERMEADPRLGTCSGKAYYRTSAGYRVSEKVGDEMSLGAVKFYRRQCFEQIGGFVPKVMWDGIDCHRCRMLGWRACSWPDSALQIQHMRAMGSSDRGFLRGRQRHGEGQYFMGTGLFYMLMSVLYRITWPPVLWGSFATFRGYLSALVRQKKRYPDVEFRRFVRRYQRRCLFQGKNLATIRLDESQGRIWTNDRASQLSQRDILL